MKPPFGLPVEKYEPMKIIRDNKSNYICSYKDDEVADYIVQAINSHWKLAYENEQPRCPCGGKLEGLGWDIDSGNEVWQCKKCNAQITIEQALRLL